MIYVFSSLLFTDIADVHNMLHRLTDFSHISYTDLVTQINWYH